MSVDALLHRKRERVGISSKLACYLSFAIAGLVKTYIVPLVPLKPNITRSKIFVQLPEHCQQLLHTCNATRKGLVKASLSHKPHRTLQNEGTLQCCRCGVVKPYWPRYPSFPCQRRDCLPEQDMKWLITSNQHLLDHREGSSQIFLLLKVS